MDRRTCELIMDAFRLSPAAEFSGPVDRGYQGEIWKVTDRGRDYALKVTLVPLAVEQARAAYAFQQRAVTFGVAAPHQHRAVDETIMISTDAGEIRLFDWVDLAGPDRGLDPAAVGELLARLHRSGGECRDRIGPWYTEPVGGERWRELVEAMASRHGPYVAELEHLRPQLVGLERWLITPDPPHTLGHCDLWADNVRAWSGPGPLVIDWDNCGPADPSQELGMVLVEFGTDPQRARTLVDAYVDAGGPGRITRPEHFSMTIAILGHVLEAGMHGWLTATTDHERERAAGRIQEWVESPLLPDHLRSLLAWVESP